MCQFEKWINEVDWRLVGSVLKALLTPLIAAIAVYVAWQQKNITSNQQKATALRSKMDLFDRRVRVLDEVRKLLSLAFQKADLSLDELRSFMAGTLPSEFLFGPEIKEYIGEVYQHGLRLWQGKENLREIHQGGAGDREKVAKQIETEMQWLAAQLSVTADKFKEYLDLSKL